jgi:hypothetical protein
MIACTAVVAMAVACGGGEARPMRSPSAAIAAEPPSTPTEDGGLGLKGSMFGDSIGDSTAGGQGLGAIAPTRVKGRLPPEVIQKIVRDHFDGMRKCYEDGLRRDPNLKGKIPVRFVIERDGHVSSSADSHDAPLPAGLEKTVRPREDEPRFPDATVTACVVAKFAALIFPEPQGGSVTVVYPIVFQSE